MTMNNEEKAKEIIESHPLYKVLQPHVKEFGFDSAIRMAQWKDEQLGWHDAKKEQPPMDEEVIVLTNVLNGKELNTPRRICFGHIVDKEICVDYDGWNIPGVAYWMYDPKLKEEQQ